MLPAESVAVTVKAKVPLCVAVPLKSPLFVSDNPVGKEPADTAKLCGPVPPPAVSVIGP